MIHFWSLVKNDILPNVNNKVPYKNLASHISKDFVPNVACFEEMDLFHNKHPFHTKDSSTDTPHSGTCAYTFLNLAFRWSSMGFSFCNLLKPQDFSCQETEEVEMKPFTEQVKKKSPEYSPLEKCSCYPVSTKVLVQKKIIAATSLCHFCSSPSSGGLYILVLN